MLKYFLKKVTDLDKQALFGKICYKNCVKTFAVAQKTDDNAC